MSFSLLAGFVSDRPLMLPTFALLLATNPNTDSDTFSNRGLRATKQCGGPFRFESKCKTLKLI